MYPHRNASTWVKKNAIVPVVGHLKNSNAQPLAMHFIKNIKRILLLCKQ
jgi:hypothetical protein